MLGCLQGSIWKVVSDLIKAVVQTEDNGYECQRLEEEARM